MCKDGIRKAKANLELSLVRDVKGNNNGFYKYISRKGRLGKLWACCWMRQETW